MYYLPIKIIGRHFETFYPPEDVRDGAPRRHLEQAAAAGHLKYEGWRVRKDGTRFVAHVVIDPIRNDQGELIGYAKVTRDITERKLAQEALRRSEERFRLLVGSVADYAILMLDPDGRVASWNAGAERIKGYRPDEIIGRHFETFYPPVDVRDGAPRRHLEQASAAGHLMH